MNTRRTDCNAFGGVDMVESTVTDLTRKCYMVSLYRVMK